MPRRRPRHHRRNERDRADRCRSPGPVSSTRRWARRAAQRASARSISERPANPTWPVSVKAASVRVGSDNAASARSTIPAASASSTSAKSTSAPGISSNLQLLDPRRQAGGFELDQQHVARIVGAEAVGLRRAGVPGARRDLDRAVPVAQRQIVEPGAQGTIRSDRVERIAREGQTFRHRAVRQADAQGGARSDGIVHPGGQVVVGSPCGQRRRQHHGTAVGDRHLAGSRGDDHVRRPAQSLQPRPDAFRQMRRRDCPGASATVRRTRPSPAAPCGSWHP